MSINKSYFINKFPKIELSYDNILHKKVSADLYLLIPQGTRAFAWFTYYKNNNLCVIIHLNKYNVITKVEEILLSFDKNLCYGTIIFGTYFNVNNTKFFSCEDIYYYKDNYVNDCNFCERLKILQNIFETEIRQVSYISTLIIFGLPIISNNLNSLFKIIPTLNYNIKGILFRKFLHRKDIGLFFYKTVKQAECIFKIKADIEADIYNLYCRNYKTNNDELYNLACIQDYKTSVMMNNLFRNIKENRNLDLLEESDEEDEFENIDVDKYVDLNKVYYMKCIYNKKFRKWKPIECVKPKEQLLTKKDINYLEF